MEYNCKFIPLGKQDLPDFLVLLCPFPEEKDKKESAYICVI